MEYFHAFWTGGLICALVQILLDKTKLMPGRVMVLLVSLSQNLQVQAPLSLSLDLEMYYGREPGKPLTARDFSAFLPEGSKPAL